MNERIKELVKQAEIKFEPYSQHQGVDTAVIIPTDLEKFAELIVRECARVAKDPVPSVHDHDAYKLGRKFAGIDVLKHFGVEE